jgi:hypothetical protein
MHLGLQEQPKIDNSLVRSPPDGELPDELETAELAVLQFDPQAPLGQIVAHA